MIDILKTHDGQNNSARFFLYDKLKINPVSVFILFIISMTLISISDSFYFLFFWVIIFISVSAYFKSFVEFIFKPLTGFKVFLFFSFGFSYISTFDIRMSSLFLLKISILILLSRFFNYFIDFKLLLSYFDSYFSRSYPVSLRITIRKTMYSLILGIEFITNLFSGARKLISVKKETASGLSFYHKNTGVLTDLFMFSFDQACRMENYYSSEKVDFLTKKQIPALVGKSDILVYLITPVIFILFLVVP